MKITKRYFLKASGAALAALPVSHSVFAQHGKIKPLSQPLTNLTANVTAISADERLARIAKAQKLMQQYDVNAMVIEPGAAMDYFSGIQWRRSERLTAIVIPREGEIGVVCPFFEEASGW
jgi:Xaa-Pro dipeptidase